MELTSFDFEHQVFSLPGAYIFGVGSDRKPMLHVSMGDLDAALPIDGLIREFDLDPESKDFGLLNLCGDALKYVKFISPGDSIPSEIVDGTASWPIEEAHYETARNSLMLKLAEWVSGGELKSGSTKDVSKLLEDPDVQRHIQEGFKKAAEALKLEGSEKVVEMIEQIGRELAYVEALRDYYVWVFGIRKQLRAAQSLVKGDRQALENTIRIDNLANEALRNYREKFDNVDAQLDDIVSALSNLPNIIEFIRISRDELHFGTMIWAEIEETWKAPTFASRDGTRRAIASLYSFLAQKFLRTDW